MADSNRGTPPRRARTNTAGELSRLHAEIDELRRETEDLKQWVGTPPKPSRWRYNLAAALVIIGCLVAALAVPAVWLNRTVMDTDRWVETVGPLAQDPAIQNAVADYATQQLFQHVDVEALVRRNLPRDTRFLAGPIAAQVESFARSEAYKLVRSPTFGKLWITANRKAHPIVIGVLAGRKGKYISSTDGKITLNLGSVMGEIKTRLNEAGLGVVAGAIGNVGGMYTLVDSPALAQASQALSLMNQFALLLPILALALLAGAVAVAADRRRALLWIGIGLAVAMVLPLGGLYLARYPYISAIQRLGTVPNAAAIAVYDTIFAGLRATQRAMLAFGLVVWIGAAIAGPSRFAVVLRASVRDGLRSLGSQWSFGRFGLWVHAYKPTLRVCGFLGGAIALLAWGSPGVSGVLWTALGVLVYVLLLEFFDREPIPQPVRKVRSAGAAAGAARKPPARKKRTA